MSTPAKVRDPQSLRASLAETRTHWADRLCELATGAYRAGDYTRASEFIMRALALDPGQAGRFEAAAKRIQVKAANAGQPAAERLSLRAQTACRLAAAGIPPGDEALERVMNAGGDEDQAEHGTGPCNWPTCPEHGERAGR